MLERRGLGLLLALGVAGTASEATAYHDAEHELVTDTAYTLGFDRTQLGIWRIDHGVAEWIDVGTVHLLWLLPFPNAQVKLRLYEERRFAIAVRTGLYYVDLDIQSAADPDSNAQIAIVPFELYLSLPLGRDFGVTLLSASTVIWLRGAYDPSEFEGAAVVDNQQLGIVGEWRASRVVKLLLGLRWLVAERARGDATVTKRIDDFTTVQIAGAAQLQAESVRNAGYVMLSTVLSWRRFNLRAGLGAGNFDVPAIHVMLPRKTLVGELDLYWRFD